MAGAPQQSPAVVLVGFMGAGKTVVGEDLARRLGLPFLDTDAAIVAAHGPIPAIFAEHGESGFRELEARAVVGELDGLASAPKVLALGGGAVLSDEVRRALSRTPHVVWLTAPPDTLWARVASGAGRPLARDAEGFRALLAARDALYREVATLVVDTSGLDVDAVVDAVVTALGASSAAVDAGGQRREGAA